MKNLFSKSLSRKKRAILLAGFIVFASAGGMSAYELTKKTVAVTLNGKEKTIRTHAHTVKDLLKQENISIHPKDYLYPSENTEINDNLKIVWKQAKQVRMVHGNEGKKVWTTAITVKEFLAEEKIELGMHDVVHPKLNTRLKDNLKIVVEEAFPLTLIDGEKKKEVWSTSTTVADFLLQQGIKLNKLDWVIPELHSTVKENDIVKVIRVEKVTDVVEEPVQYAVLKKKDSTLSEGMEKTLIEGQNGLIKRTYEITIENGKEISRKVINETTLREKQDKVVAVGTKSATQLASRGRKNAVKEFYVVATAYTANCNGCSGITFTGINLRANPNMKVIAVDPRVIPLGTKVYVEGYGYATAQDTGSAIKGNRIDVFFQTKSQAYRWGKKSVKIKILE